jgi:multiple sugar transport system substrate-binding protein
VRKEITRRSFLQVSLGAGAVLLAGCGGGGPQNNPALQGGGSGDSGRTYDGPRVNLEFWNGLTGGDGPFMRTLVERFNGQHDNISVRMNAIVWDEYYQKLPAAVAAGEGPDVGLVHNFNLGTVAARGVLRPLEDVVEALGYTAEDFSPAVWRAGIYDGQRYGLPLDVIPFGLFYNKTLLEEAGADPDSPPRTKDELEQVLERLKERGTRGFWVDPNLPIVSWLYQSVLPQYGGSLFNEDGTRATFNSDGGVEALSWLVSLVERGYSPKDAGADSTFTAFQNSKNAFYWSGGWNITPFTETEDLSFGLAPPPRIGPELATWAASHNLVLPQNRNQDENRTQAATVFVNWLLTNSAEWAKSGQVPARKSVRESEEFTSLRWQPVLAETLPYAKFSAVVPGYDVIESRALGPALNDALLLNVEPKAALDRAAQTANGLLEENRRKYQG